METSIINTKQLRVPFWDTTPAGISEIAGLFGDVRKTSLAYAPWQDQYPYKPEVQFAIAYSTDSLYLQYDVKEAVVQAANGRINDPVHRDSCVEAFFSLDDGATYYNIEFNCLGTVMAAFGKDRNKREFLPEALLEQIHTQTLIRKECNRFVRWQLTIAIPLGTFLQHPLTSLQGQKCRANFYKCGDNLPEPHFLCWSTIQSNVPDFHQPPFFGTLLFE
jgi:hypothetical protein